MTLLKGSLPKTHDPIKETGAKNRNVWFKSRAEAVVNGPQPNEPCQDAETLMAEHEESTKEERIPSGCERNNFKKEEIRKVKGHGGGRHQKSCRRAAAAECR